MARGMISFGSRMEEDMSFSRAVIDGDLVFVSGTTGYDYESMTIKPDVAAQAEQAFLNIERALAQANATLDDTTHVTFIIPTRSDWPLCWPVIKKYLGRSKPASTMFHAGLYTDDMKIEIQVTARIATRFTERK
jgi:enamine deaminase RidA (YjgF/YER057c/UK114 family)